MKRICIHYMLGCLLLAGSAIAVDAPDSPPLSELPLLEIKDFQYAGAFRLPAKEFGDSSFNFAVGPIALSSDQSSLFMVGHVHHLAITEVKIPELVADTEVTKLPMAEEPLQPFSRVMDRPSGGNPEGNNRIGGMLCVEGLDGPVLLVNTYQYYDAPADNRTSMLVVRNPRELAKSEVDGYFELKGEPGHTAGWMSPIPGPWQEKLGGRYLTGHSSGIPIISRCSVGPSAFVFDPQDVLKQEMPSAVVETAVLLDFSLKQPLASDLSNESKKNDLWTHLSRASYGFIVPGTRTYATFGSSGGHESGVGYKNVRDDGSRSGGYSSYKVVDNHPYYWLWDVSDLLRVKMGELKPHEVRPYAHGIFKTPFNDLSHRIGGGDYDAASNRLYLTLLAADREQGRYSNPPIVMVYKIASGREE